MNLPKYWHRGYLRWTPRLCNNFSNVKEKNKHINDLCKCLDISENVAHHICMKQPVIKKLDKERLITAVDTICNLGFSKEVLIEQPALFGILPITLRFRFEVLQECGLENVTPSILLAYLKVLKQKQIGDLKKEGLIPLHLNIENRLASYLTQWPTSLTSSIWGDISKLSLYYLRIKIIQRYLELLLDLTAEEYNRGITTYPTIKHRPLKVINNNLNILQSQIMMPTHKIKSNLYLIHADPDNLKQIILNFRAIGGIDIKEVIRMHPKIALKNYRTMVETRKVLKQYGISNEAQIRCFDIYTLGTKTVKERLEKAKSIPELNAFFNHPRFLKMIHYNTTVMKRMNKLYSHNKKCLSLNVLSGSSNHYETFEKAPGDRLGKGKDLIFCISQSLGKGYKISDIRKIIKRHPFWINIPLVQIKFVYEQLSTQFTAKDIYENCPILLYPWNKIRDKLNLFQSKKTQMQLIFYHENIDFNKLNKSQKLSLILYALEKNHYFTGNGVWTEDKYKNHETTDVKQPEKCVSLGVH